MDSLLLILGAGLSALFGLAVLALALWWLQDCQRNQADMYEQLERTNERLHKATANMTYLESMNYEWADKNNIRQKEIYRLQGEMAQISRELDEARANLAGRGRSRRDDE